MSKKKEKYNSGAKAKKIRKTSVRPVILDESGATEAVQVVEYVDDKKHKMDAYPMGTMEHPRYGTIVCKRCLLEKCICRLTGPEARAYLEGTAIKRPARTAEEIKKSLTLEGRAAAAKEIMDRQIQEMKGEVNPPRRQDG